MIPAELSGAFTHGARARGERYVAERRIQLLASGEPLLVNAIARGSEPWLVTLDARERGLVMTCACPFAMDRGYCKHLWATLRVVDEKRLLKPLLDASGGVYREQSGDNDDDLGIFAENSILDTLLLTDRPDRPSAPREPKRASGSAPAWRRALEDAQRNARYENPAPPAAEWPSDRRLVYLADINASRSADGLVIELATEKVQRDGSWGLPKLFRSALDSWMNVPDPLDREIGQMLRGSRRTLAWARTDPIGSFVVEPAAFDPVLRLMSETGRLRIRRDPHDRPVDPAQWDDRGSWKVHYAILRDRRGLELAGILRRGGVSMPFDAPSLLHNAGFLVHENTIARVEIDGPFALLNEVRTNGAIRFEDSELAAVVGALAELPRAPRLELAEGLNVSEVAPRPVPVLRLTRPSEGWRRGHLNVALSFDYDGVDVSDSRPGTMVFDARSNRIVRRDRSAEAEARQLLSRAGVRKEHDWRTSGTALVVPSGAFEPLLRDLTAAGWRVIVDGVPHRITTDVTARVRSGVDWFDLEIQLSFGDAGVSLPRVLEALRNKESTIELENGGVGVLTADVRRRLAPLVAMAGAAKGLRFRHSQTALLDALLELMPSSETDERFERARAEIRRFERVEACVEPATFQGELRQYQREGLGWFAFLRQFGLGGCLADDMGLGKTVQALALLESRRLENAGPSLVVSPRSLIFNWKQEAARFAPSLRVLDHTGAERSRGSIGLTDEQLVITTYGTLRRDIAALREMEFDYVILDEAQAIKNATTAAAKAARLLRARHRLALSGTPIENNVQELWSLFEFLNPGMFGAASTFRSLARARVASDDDETAKPNDNGEVALLARALRPVILRRTKERVAPELPPKLEQTLVVELEPEQRRIYDELLAHYRRSLLPYIDRMGMERSRMKVLEALLRLRQAACHPALISRTHADAPSAKLDVIQPKLAEAAAEGHKSLVFSQFTSFLALLRERLDADSAQYAYLDGDTRDRQAVVEQFQQDPNCKLFLISLRAGGHGLNLTAADYVFLLDPWWNPAVEAQAIDRAHRIGQQRHVIATRLVAQGTIEEKILELQRSKRDLADAILSEDQGALAQIGREELELLLA
ncbi:MAG TPA: DEAD/DEAH box helicase [Gemmatimonadaceae bacterium]|nr:DEAD/DEAH box helicase [Gemmatimonadaceae bacterium]